MSNNGTKQLFDLDAVIAERDRGPFLFRLKGHEWTFPADPGIEAMDLLTQGKVVETIYALLGDQRDEFRTVVGDLGMIAATKLVDAYTEYVKVDLGKLEASSDS